jgi:hypothetical protein
MQELQPMRVFIQAQGMGLRDQALDIVRGGDGQGPFDAGE